MTPRFQPDDTLYKQRNTLKVEYVPDDIVGRDDETEAYEAALQPVINGEYPDNIFIYGKTGVGKTAVTNFLLNDLAESAEFYDVELTVVDMNCDGLSTSYQAAIRLINELREPEHHIAETGHPQSKVYRLLWNELNDLTGTVLLVLDEIDHIRDDTFLYQITRADNNGYIDNIQLGLIGISNDSTFRERLDAKVQSSLCETEISFPPYDAGELRKVLEQRADIAFYEGALDDGVLSLCAAHGRQDGGDARRAITLLRKAGDLARTEKATKVTTDHVRRAQEKLEAQQSMDIMRDLTEHEQLTLYALTTLSAKGESPARSRIVYQRYKEFCHHSRREPRTARRIRGFLSDFEILNLTVSHKQHRGQSGGTYREHELNRDIATVVDALQTLIEEVGAHRSIVEYLPDTGNDKKFESFV
ncbi:orc1/cdc6 family replication initiation protein [Haloprofundus salilacus]|uniref:orc1/cdc6 family replication initiation protein n=1 Tax=Haloprofundus salilacus TaxID=2876190 RepID=UPI001CCF5AA5|nr:orc1/cdc6 family replication initiation protein [Haloprofundus salilacus]